MKHAERCDRITYCGRYIRPSEKCRGRDIPDYDCVEREPWPEDMCSRCRAGVTPFQVSRKDQRP